MRVGNIGATGKVAYCAEELGIVGVLDGRLNKVWEVTGITGTHSTGQIELADINGDGDLEILVNTGEDFTAGFLIASRRASTWGGWMAWGGILTHIWMYQMANQIRRTIMTVTARLRLCQTCLLRVIRLERILSDFWGRSMFPDYLFGSLCS